MIFSEKNFILSLFPLFFHKESPCIRLLLPKPGRNKVSQVLDITLLLERSSNGDRFSRSRRICHHGGLRFLPSIPLATDSTIPANLISRGSISLPAYFSFCSPHSPSLFLASSLSLSVSPSLVSRSSHSSFPPLSSSSTFSSDFRRLQRRRFIAST